MAWRTVPSHKFLPFKIVLQASAKGLGIVCRVFAAPTVLTIHFEGHGLFPPRTFTGRPPGGLNTHNLQCCDALARIVETGSLSSEDACARLDAIIDAPPLCKQFVNISLR